MRNQTKLNVFFLFFYSCGGPETYQGRKTTSLEQNQSQDQTSQNGASSAQQKPEQKTEQVEESVEKPLENNTAETDKKDEGQQTPPSQKENEFELTKVEWLDKNISSWNQSSKLTRVYFNDKFPQVCFDFDKYRVWQANGDNVVANNWVFVQKDPPHGPWYGSTFEWFATYDNCKWKKAVAGDHMKKFNIFPAEWKPAKGQKVGFMLSTLVRNGARSPDGREERTDIVFVEWPGE